MKIRISTHKDNATVGIITITDDVSESSIDDIANEPAGLADLVEMGESTVPAGYEWSGDEEYEILDSSVEEVMSPARKELVDEIQSLDLVAPDQVEYLVLTAYDRDGMQAARQQLQACIDSDAREHVRFGIE